MLRIVDLKINPAGIFLSTGSVLYSVGLTPLFTIVADTCGKGSATSQTAATTSCASSKSTGWPEGPRRQRQLLSVRAGGRVISNCAHINNPVNDYNPTPIRVRVWQP